MLIYYFRRQLTCWVVRVFVAVRHLWKTEIHHKPLYSSWLLSCVKNTCVPELSWNALIVFVAHLPSIERSSPIFNLNIWVTFVSCRVLVPCILSHCTVYEQRRSVPRIYVFSHFCLAVRCLPQACPSNGMFFSP